MERRGDQVVESESEASAGSKEGVVRWVLLIGLVLVIVLMSIVWITGALSTDDVEEQGTVSGKIEAMESSGASADGMVDAPTVESELPGDTATSNPAPAPTAPAAQASEPAA